MCTPPHPDVVWCPPPRFSLLTAPLCLSLARSCDREVYSAGGGVRRLNTVWGRNAREQPCSFVHSPAGLPAFQSTIQTSECLDKGRLCPPSAGYTLSCSCPPPRLTLLSILLDLLCLPLFTCGSSPQNSTAGPL